MHNSTTSWQEAVRLRCYQKLMAENPSAFATTTQEGSRSLGSKRETNNQEIKNLEIEIRSGSFKRIDLEHVKVTKKPENPINESFKTIDQELTGPFKYTGPADPDGLNEHIIGKFAKFLKHDDHLLQARLWKCHPATLTAAIKRMGLEWVQKQVEFVAGEKQVKLKGHYLAAILKRNGY